MNTNPNNGNERQDAPRALTTEQIQAGYISPSRLRGVIVAYSGARYAGTPYILVYTPSGDTYWVRRGADRPEFFKMMNTVSFTPVPTRTKLRKFPDPFMSGEDPLEMDHDISLPIFIPGVVISTNNKHKTCKIRMVVNEFHMWHEYQEKLVRTIYYDQLTKDSITPMAGDDIFFATQTHSFGKNSTARWPSICAIAADEEKRVRSFTMATTRTLYDTIQGNYDFNLEIGGTTALASLPCFLAQHETRITSLDGLNGGANILGEVLALTEDHYTRELHKLNETERKTDTHPVVVGERAFRMARTQQGHRLRILINPLLFKHIDTDAWTRLAERYCNRHDGSLVESIHILTIMDDRSNGENWTTINPLLHIMKTPLTYLHSISFTPEEAQLGRWAPGEWVDRRSDCRYMIATLDFMMEAQASQWPDMITLGESNREEVGDGTDTEMESYFNDSTALLASTPHRFRRDKGLLGRWRAKGNIKGAAPRRQGGAEFVCRVLKHRSADDRELTAIGLREPSMVGGMAMRHFMCMAADTFFNSHTLNTYSPVIVLAINTDHNVIYETLGEHTAMHPVGKGEREIRIHNAWLTKVEIRMKLAQVNLDCQAAGQPRPFQALLHGYNEKPTWLVPRRPLEPTHSSHTPHRADGNKGGLIYISGLEADHDMDIITRTLHSLTILPSHQPRWVEVDGYHRDLIEVRVPNMVTYEGVHFKAETGIDICTVTPNTDASISQDGCSVFAPLIPDGQAHVRHPPSNYYTSDIQKQMLLAIRKANKKRAGITDEPATEPEEDAKGGKGGRGRGRGRGRERDEGKGRPSTPPSTDQTKQDQTNKTNEQNNKQDPPHHKHAREDESLGPLMENEFALLYNADSSDEEEDEGDEGGEGEASRAEENKHENEREKAPSDEDANTNGASTAEGGGGEASEEGGDWSEGGGAAAMSTGECSDHDGSENERDTPTPPPTPPPNSPKKKKRRKNKNENKKKNKKNHKKNSNRGGQGGGMGEGEASPVTTGDEELSSGESSAGNTDGEEEVVIIKTTNTHPNPTTLTQNSQRNSRQKKRAASEGTAEEGKQPPHPSPLPSPLPPSGNRDKREEETKRKQAKKKPAKEKGQPSVAAMFRTSNNDISNTNTTPPPTPPPTGLPTPSGEEAGSTDPTHTTGTRDQSLSPSRRGGARSRSRSPQDSPPAHRLTDSPLKKGGNQQ